MCFDVLARAVYVHTVQCDLRRGRSIAHSCHMWSCPCPPPRCARVDAQRLLEYYGIGKQQDERDKVDKVARHVGLQTNPKKDD